jgi:hypothetical protein
MSRKAASSKDGLAILRNWKTLNTALLFSSNEPEGAISKDEVTVLDVTPDLVVLAGIDDFRFDIDLTGANFAILDMETSLLEAAYKTVLLINVSDTSVLSPK